MKVQYSILIILTMLISGCTHTRHFSTAEFDDVNKAIKGKNATIKLTNGNVTVGRNIQFVKDSIFWIDRETCRKRSIQTSEISQIVLLKKGRGALHGSCFGFLIGGLIGSQDIPTDLGTIDASAETVLFSGAFFGIFCGLPIGAVVGSKEKFILKQTPGQVELVKPTSMAKVTSSPILRSETRMIFSDDSIRSMLETHGFYDAKFNKNGKGITHQYEAKILQGAPVIIDHLTGLMWMKDGSTKALNFISAGKYICKLNTEVVGGFTDWRFPTLEEAMSLVESKMLNGNLYIDPLFDQKQQVIWTADQCQEGRWAVNFKQGGCFKGLSLPPNTQSLYVRAVRTL